MREIEPTTITQGERVEWTREFDDFPAVEWTLEYRFRGPGQGFNVTATADGQAFNAAVTTAQSQPMTSGRYHWQAWATNIATPADIRMIDSGETRVERGFAVSPDTVMDLRTPARITLDAIDAALQAFAVSDIQEYEITTPAGSQRVKRSDKMQLTSQRKYWAGIVAREQAAERTKRTGKIGRAIGIVMREQ